jgi:queuine tRNA-ribosyltransferase
MFAFDECPSPLSTEKYLRESVDRTHRWAARCIEARDAGRRRAAQNTEVRPLYIGQTSVKDAVDKSGMHGYMQALYGIVQGGGFADMRADSARTLGAMDFEGFGIGGEFGYDKESLEAMLRLTTSNLPNNKPRHVLGVGHPEDFDYVARGGGDTFDCIAPTHYARRGVVFVRDAAGQMGRIDLRKKEMLTDYTPLDPNCACPTCATYTRSFISHLIRSNELTGMKLATAHNIYYFNQLSHEVRARIQRDEL